MIRTLFCSLSAVVFLGGGAAAAPAPEPASVHVSIADLDLSRAPGAQAALQRIHAAARIACGGESDLRRLDRRGLFRACVRSATDRAVASSRSALLAELNGGPAPVLQVAQAH